MAQREPARTILVDACGLQCPGPIMKVYQTMNEIETGDVLEVHATDPGFTKDIQSWSKRRPEILCFNQHLRIKNSKHLSEKVRQKTASIEPLAPAKKKGRH